MCKILDFNQVVLKTIVGVLAMSFKKFIDDAWMKHEKKTTEVVASYKQGIQLLQSEEDVLALGRLVAHIATDHNFSFANLRKRKR